MTRGPFTRLPDGLHALGTLVTERFAPDTHGDLPRWLEALSRLPCLTPESVTLGDRVSATGPASAGEQAALRDALMELRPWRKGPFSLFGVDIDTEWRSDWKWARVRPHLAPLAGHRVLDVGCGNGYFGWRMLQAGAREVVGVDPTLLFCTQHQALCRYLGHAAGPNWVLPVRFEELPEVSFDSVFSMGVIYHRRDPGEHVERLWRVTRPGGQVVVESLVVRPEAANHRDGLVPGGRYARMRNVHLLPTPEVLTRWLSDAGFVDVRVADLTPTTTGEQRSTAWMRFESLAEALDPAAVERTVEGHPAPLRGVVVARKPV